jgi:hypothetical protein
MYQGFHGPVIGGLNVYIKCIVEKGLHAPGIGWLNTYIKCVVEYNGEKGLHASCLTVASGWNKERCIPEILPFLLTKARFMLLLFQGGINHLSCLQHWCIYKCM